MGDKRTLSRKRSEPRSDVDVASAIARQVRALGKRVGGADPDSAQLLTLVGCALDDAWAGAVAEWRATGFSDTEIGHELHVTKQAVQQRWPRASN